MGLDLEQERVPRERIAAAIEELRSALGDSVSTTHADRDQHGRDESRFLPLLPDGVVFAHATEDVSTVLTICHRHSIPVIPFGAGSSVEGHVLPVRGGIALDTTGLDEIIEVNVEDLDCRVGAGVTRSQLEGELRRVGLFFPVDPGADATLGGMAATAASGTTTVRYGAMRSNVLGMTVVLADGRVVQTGGRARKSSAGYGLTGLFVGSEGTLGVITELQLRLYGIPEHIEAAVCQFDDLGGAVSSAMAAVQLGIPLARIELLDAYSMAAVDAHSDLGGEFEIAPTLFLEFHGSSHAVSEQARQFADIASSYGSGSVRTATKAEDRNRLWRARHDVLYACLASRPGSRPIATDCCVPISTLADNLMAARRDIDESDLVAPLLGHVGDGNFHAVFLVDPDDQQELARAEAVNERMVSRALDSGGTCTGEHGVGAAKKSYLELEHGAGVEVMRSLKWALDPQGIMNPGKVFDAAAEG